jgi:hypothetical protein
LELGVSSIAIDASSFAEGTMECGSRDRLQ